MSPVTKAAMPDVPKIKVAIKMGATGPDPTPPSAVKTENNMESRMKAAAKPTDHLPNEVFGRIVIRTVVSYTPK